MLATQTLQHASGGPAVTSSDSESLQAELTPDGKLFGMVVLWSVFLFFLLIPLQVAALSIPWYKVELSYALFYNGGQPSRLQGGRFSLSEYQDCTTHSSFGQAGLDFACTFAKARFATFPDTSVLRGPGATTLSQFSQATFVLLMLCLLSSIIGFVDGARLRAYGYRVKFYLYWTSAFMLDPWNVHKHYHAILCIQTGVQFILILSGTLSYRNSIDAYVRRYMGTGACQFVGGYHVAAVASAVAAVLFGMRLYLYARVLQHFEYTRSAQYSRGELPNPVASSPPIPGDLSAGAQPMYGRVHGQLTTSRPGQDPFNGVNPIVRNPAGSYAGVPLPAGSMLPTQWSPQVMSYVQGGGGQEHHRTGMGMFPPPPGMLSQSSQYVPYAAAPIPYPPMVSMGMAIPPSPPLPPPPPPAHVGQRVDPAEDEDEEEEGRVGTSVSEERLCAVCLDKEKNTAFECGHQACRRCSKQLTSCHICRMPITLRVRLYG